MFNHVNHVAGGHGEFVNNVPNCCTLPYLLAYIHVYGAWAVINILKD